MEQLFGSKTRVKLLKLFMSNPNRAFYVREITRKIDEQINSVRRELANLLNLGVITSDSTNNKLYYEVNQKNPQYAVLRELFTGNKTADEDVKLKKVTKNSGEKITKAKVENTDNVFDSEVWSGVAGLDGLAYSGTFTRDTKSPVDIMIVGNVSVRAAESAIRAIEKREGRELRYSVIDTDEWKYRAQVHDKFWSQVNNSKKQIIIDKENIFEK